ncbi:hypothetical protein [Niveibacterium umoris]|uniref:Uncharacterized protein n=1 Tax=Niveibacterium umoris TaxID=1193620 RepID=A0A840BQS6_9RHOO|nr:hypothetical protein [Niveibacterium umoris]MBB4014973.1 hypothetical protein [Niveibacterium umoris]
MKSLVNWTFVVICMAYAVGALSKDNVEDCNRSKVKTYPFGEVYRSQCGTAKTGYRDTIYLNGSAVLSDSQLFDDDSNSDRSIRIYTSGESSPQSGCSPRLYLVDFSKKPAKVIAFGVKKACNEFHWASWGEKRSVIALKKNVKFVYEDGVMTLPKAGKTLWDSIEPPHAGPGLSEEDAVPFAEEVPQPK